MVGYRPYELIQIVVNPDETRTFDIVLAEGLTERVVVVAERTPWTPPTPPRTRSSTPPT